ncbi:MAG: C25 family cysteine peptidase, partial [Bacteroidales bacterium]
MHFTAGFIEGQQVKSHKYSFNDSPRKTEIVRYEDRIIIYYNVPEITLISANTTIGEFYKLSVPGHGISSEPAKPEMPVYSKLISIPGKVIPQIEICNVKTSILNPGKNNFRGKVFPRQEDLPKSQGKQRNVFLIDHETYNKKGFLSHDTVRVEYIGNIRNTGIVNLSIYPVRYSPRENKLEVITSMKISIKFPPEAKSELLDNQESLPFIQSLSKGLLNYGPEDVIKGYSEEPLKMIIITDTIFKKTLSPYIKWKIQKGFRITTLFRGTGLAGNTFSELKDTLTKIYNYENANGSPPEYLLIVGDVTRIPPAECPTNYTDLYYSTFDGTDDYLPEMFTGRLPVADTSELKSVLKKLIHYEKFEFADTNRYYQRSLITAGDDATYANYMNGQIKYAKKYYLNSSNHITNYIFYYPQSVNARDSIIKLFNMGLGFVNYSGHGNTSGWLSPLVESEDVTKFTNKNMYPFVISNACRTGQFNVTNSFGNTLIKSDEKGAAGFIGCSNDSYWNEDFYWTVGVGSISSDPLYEETGLAAYDRLFHNFGEKASEWYITMGQVNYAGNLSVTASTSSKKKYYWEIYNLLGDPSIIPYIGLPDTFRISLPDTLPNKIRSLSLTIEPYSYIAISHFDSLWDASYASASGSVTLDIPERSNDSCLIVVTGQNRIPLIKKIYIKSVNREFINLTKTEINDIQGNNDGKADYGENVFLKLTISNLGLTSANQLFVKISSPSPGWFTILNDSVYIGNLNGLSETVTDNQ